MTKDVGADNIGNFFLDNFPQCAGVGIRKECICFVERYMRTHAHLSCVRYHHARLHVSLCTIAQIAMRAGILSANT